MKKSATFKKKLSVSVLCIVLILTTIFGLTLFSPRADYESREFTHRFKQIAAGGDFALAVSYSGDLYAWSLGTARLNSATSFGTWDNNSTKLGDYYPTVPTKIDIGADIKVKKVAATRYNAALLTTSSTGANPTTAANAADKVFTWGPIIAENNIHGGNGSPHPFMQLRPGEEAAELMNRPVKVNGMVASTNVLTDGAMEWLGNGTVLDIAASENNFIARESESIAAWGSNLFGQLGSVNAANQGYGAIYGFRSFSAENSGIDFSSPFNFYVGKDYIVARSGGTNPGSLYISGKNFYLNEGSDNPALSTPSFDVTGVGSSHSEAAKINLGGGVFESVANGALGTFFQINGASGVKAPVPVSLKDAAGNTVTTEFANPTVAAGAGFLYYIDSSNRVQMLGNDYAGQAGETNTSKTHKSSAAQISAVTGTPVQVVAGKNSYDAKHSVFRPGTESDPKYSLLYVTDSTDIGDTVNIGSLSGGTPVIGSSYADFASDTEYISAALNENGDVFAWNAEEPAARITALDNLGLRSTGAFNGRTEQIVSLTAGYGNILFALTNTGKMIEIRDTETGFTAKYHDDFCYTAGTLLNPTVAKAENWQTESDYIRQNEPTSDPRRFIHFAKSNESGAANPIYAKIGLNGAEVYSGSSPIAADQFAQVGTRTRTGDTGGSSKMPVYTYTHLTGARQSFIGKNNTGDALRFLVNRLTDGEFFFPQQAAGYTVPADSVYKNNLISNRTPAWEGGDASVKFYYNYDTAPTEVDPYIAAQHFDFKINIGATVNGTSEDISFQFWPKKSTAYKTITAEFSVARFNNKTEYDSANPTIYEIKRVAIDIVIDFTEGKTAKKFDARNNYSETPDGVNVFDGIIPQLDVNGVLNQKYSIAAMDVSTGFEKLGTELNKVTGGAFDPAGFVGAVHNSLTGNYNPSTGNRTNAKDEGFPSSLYGPALEYYDINNYTSANSAVNGGKGYYNDRYKYFADSVDGTLIVMNDVRAYIQGTTVSDQNFANTARRTVTVSIDLRKPLYGTVDAGTPQWAELIDSANPNGNYDENAFKLNEYLKNGSKFDNKYGFYKVSGTENTTDLLIEGGSLQSGIVLTSAGVLELSYQVFTIEAKNQNDTAAYNVDREINKPILARLGTSSENLNFVLGFTEWRLNRSNNTLLDPVFNIAAENQHVSVHTQASLKLKPNVTTEPNVYGHPNSNTARYKDQDRYPVNPGSPSQVGSDGLWTVTVGLAGSTDTFSDCEVKLKDLMAVTRLDTGKYDFKFKYGTNVNEQGHYTDFTKLFDEKVTDLNRTYLSSDTMRFFFTDAADANFTIEIVRVARDGTAFKIDDGNGLEPAEQIKLQFVIRATVTGSFTHTPKTSPITVSGLTELPVTDLVNAAGIPAEYVAFSDFKVVNNSVATVTLSANGRTLFIKPQASGVTDLCYSISLLGRTLPGGEFVSAKTVAGVVGLSIRHISEYPKTWSIAVKDQMQLGDLSSFLMAENRHLNLTSLRIDTAEGDNGSGVKGGGITVQHSLLDEKNNPVGWKTVPVSETPYIESAALYAVDGGNNYDQVRVEIKSVSLGSDVGVCRILVHFEGSNASGKISLTASVAIKPAHTELTARSGEGTEESPYRYSPLMMDIQYSSGLILNLQGALKMNELPVYGVNEINEKLLTVPIEFFFANQFQSTRDSSEYAIKTASITDSRIVNSTDANKYFTCDPDANGGKLEIVPIYPTEEIVRKNPGTVDGVRVTVTFTSMKTEGVRDSFQYSFYIRVSQIKMTLTQKEWGTVFGWAALAAFAFLFIVFIFRFGFYLKRKGDQKRIIKKNQMLIRMRDKMHHSAGAPNREQAVKAKLRMSDPKYAKMFDEMRREKEEESGITLDNSAIARNAKNTTKTQERVKAAKKTKQKGGKKSIEDLKAELEAKRSALAQMQSVGVPNGGTQMDGGIPMDPVAGAPVFEPGDEYNYNAELSREDVEDQIKAKLGEDGFIEFEPMSGDEDML